jgi:hypothetical protein
MIKPMERGKQQDPDYEKEKHEYPDQVRREDGIPTIDDWERLLGKEGVVTGRKKKEEEEDHEGCGMMVVKKTVTSGSSPLEGIMDSMKPPIDLDKVDSRHDDIIKLVESILSLSRK